MASDPKEAIVFESTVRGPQRVMHAGRYYLSGRQGVSLTVKDRPTWLQRRLMSLLLGIEWVDEPHEVQECPVAVVG